MHEGRRRGRNLGTLLPAIALSTAVLAGCAGAKNAAACDGQPPRPAAQPNFLVVMTDDQTVESLRVMPNVNRLLRRQGTTFSNMVVNDSDCCPSRATMLTGQQSRHHGVLWNAPPTGGFEAFTGQDTTLPVALQSAGYETVMIGKYLNRFGARDPEDRYVPPGWDDFKATLWPAESLYYEAAFFDNGRVVETGEDDYVTDVITRYATDAIDRIGAGSKPFFMLVGQIAPHGEAGIPLREADPANIDAQIAERYPYLVSPATPEEKYANRFSDEQLPASPAFDEADVSDKPEVLQRRPLDTANIDAIRGGYRAELRTLLSVDDSVKVMIDALEAKCMLDNTYVVYTSDNGYFHGEHRYPYGKYLAYQPSRDVPLIVRGPGVKAGAVQPSVVSNVDFAPTFAELAGATLLREPDGRSLVPLLRAGPSERWGRAVYLEGHAPDGPLRPQFDGLYTGTFSYFDYGDAGTEFYDLVKDPDELNNLAGLPEAAGKIRSAQNLLRQLRECKGANCAAIGSELAVASAG